ncbi:MAG: hypothetical protein IKG37_04375 [Solobacterium sp.]|nr:hypothetical protein [Solobacterium sp.]
MKKIKKKICFYKAILAEILETMCTICLYLRWETHFGRNNPHAYRLDGHFKQLKDASSVLRRELAKGQKNE